MWDMFTREITGVSFVMLLLNCLLDYYTCWCFHLIILMILSFGVEVYAYTWVLLARLGGSWPGREPSGQAAPESDHICETRKGKH